MEKEIEKIRIRQFKLHYILKCLMEELTKEQQDRLNEKIIKYINII